MKKKKKKNPKNPVLSRHHAELRGRRTYRLDVLAQASHIIHRIVPVVFSGQQTGPQHGIRTTRHVSPRGDHRVRASAGYATKAADPLQSARTGGGGRGSRDRTRSVLSEKKVEERLARRLGHRPVLLQRVVRVCMGAAMRADDARFASSR